MKRERKKEKTAKVNNCKFEKKEGGQVMTDAEEGESCRDTEVMEYHNETSGDCAAV